CFTCTKDFNAAVRVARGLAQRGFAVMRFDFAGLGHSEGDFADSNFSTNVEDLTRAADWLRDNLAAPALLIGHSMGGAAAIAAAEHVPEAIGVVTINSPADPGHLGAVLSAARDQAMAAGEATVNIGGRPYRLRKQFFDDIADQPQSRRIANLRKALLILHSVADETVSIDNAAKIFQQAKHPKSFVSLDRADHILSNVEDAEYVAEVIAAWASRYLPAEAETQTAVPHTVIVRESGFGKFMNDIVAGEHRLTTDEPRAAGGDDTGPTPYDLLLAALGSCTSMTLRMYADRKDAPLDRVTVRMKHRKVHAADCADCESKDGAVDWIERDITLDGADLTAEQRKRLIEIAERCPVHRTLQSEVVIKTREAARSEKDA
ncbi:MAG: alpha/beta fold hydrolase, partial [Phycisphaerales bacterium]|nr:alpha/beta fold hydrolase [Phycisphaerales bacterium]